MRRTTRDLFLIFFMAFFCSSSFSQYVVNGSATSNSCHCYTLTTATTYQAGSVWSLNKINLNSAFDLRFNVYLACADAKGADGIAFVLQPTSTNMLSNAG